MVAAARAAKRVLKCGFNHRHHPAVLEARKRFENWRLRQADRGALPLWHLRTAGLREGMARRSGARGGRAVRRAGAACGRPVPLVSRRSGRRELHDLDRLFPRAAARGQRHGAVPLGERRDGDAAFEPHALEEPVLVRADGRGRLLRGRGPGRELRHRTPARRASATSPRRFRTSSSITAAATRRGSRNGASSSLPSQKTACRSAAISTVWKPCAQRWRLTKPNARRSVVRIPEFGSRS